MHSKKAPCNCRCVAPRAARHRLCPARRPFAGAGGRGRGGQWWRAPAADRAGCPCRTRPAAALFPKRQRIDPAAAGRTGHRPGTAMSDRHLPLSPQRGATPAPAAGAALTTPRRPASPHPCASWPGERHRPCPPQRVARPRGGAGGQPAAAPPLRRSPPAPPRCWRRGRRLLGGLLLNLMPCVFRCGHHVLGLRKRQHRRAQRRWAAYTAGVVLSFWRWRPVAARAWRASSWAGFQPLPCRTGGAIYC